jgi:prepilin-type N-terminal cleavage/methylation domain-containing protein
MRVTRPTPLARVRAGFTLIEVVVAATLTGLIVANLYMVFGDSSKAIRAKTIEFDTEVEARRVLDRIAMSVIGAERATVDVATEAPLSSNSINYQVSNGFTENEVEFSPVRRIAHDGTTQISWAESPGSASERRAVWTSHAAQFLAGEIENGIDDNGNGLIDEGGLSFDFEGDKMVVIRLTIRRRAPEGTLTTKTLETRVCCRN